jgi:uncharacterized protein YdeI (YjbR/CyaY-like superfamily)
MTDLVLPFPSPDDWERWLEEHHVSCDGLWLKIAKKASGIATVTHADALEVALCFGWIDATRRAHDDTWFLQRFTPRRARSRWSKINREKVEALTRDGRMRPAGLAQIEAAKADGRWEAAYAGQASAAVPPDLQAAFDDEPALADAFASLSSQNRYSIIYRLGDAKRAETRARRLIQFVEMLREGRGPHG